jgi:hypothetical protein
MVCELPSSSLQLKKNRGLREIVCDNVALIHLIPDRGQLRILVNTRNKFTVSIKYGEFDDRS